MTNSRETTPDPKITIVIPVYNRERYLPTAIESVLGQTYKDFELLIWDDGSTDTSLAIASRYAQRDSRIRVIAAPHQGVSHALKGAFAEAKGMYIGQVDSDDILDWRALELTVPILETYPEVGLVYTDYLDINQNGQILGLGHRCSIPYSKDRILIDFMLFHFRLIRRSVYEQVGGVNCEEYEIIPDYELCLRLTEITEVHKVSQPLYYYRHHPQTICKTKHIQQILLCQKAINQALERRGMSERYQLRVEVQARFFVEEKPIESVKCRGPDTEIRPS
ncbi:MULTISPECIES: glycosyltransferase [unclassified Microcoleus]|uniref:glycosyltransferase n=1 Tax=unclassified Microcoleus TaxID=2642155 RepID=UPI002FD2FD31